jgi:uncharacterized membrane protein YoaK (UPF0700 family)
LAARRAGVFVRVFEAICFLSFGKVFAGFQTGNIVLLGIAVAGTRPPLGPQPATVLVSLAAFAVGAAVATPILKPIMKSLRKDRDTAVFEVWPWPVSAALAGTVAVEAGFLAAWLATSPSTSLHSAWTLTGLAALAMGIQMNAIRALHVPSISTTAASATYIGLISGTATGSLKVPEARRLAAVLVAITAGALYGDSLLRHAHAWAPVLPVVVTAAVVTGASATFPRS